MQDAATQLLFHQHCADGEVRVWQHNNRRWLDFNDGLIQSEIILDLPGILPLPLNRAMLAGLMFVKPIKRVLLVGTGGGATARYLSHLSPDISGDAIEISATISSIATEYFDFPTSQQWQIFTADIVNYLPDCQQRYDLIVIDIAEQQLTPQWLLERSFLQQYKNILSQQGHIAFNLLVSDANAFMHYLSNIRQVFDRRTVCLSMPNYRNTVVLAFNQHSVFSHDEIALRLSSLELLWGLEFNDFYQQMLQDNPQGSGVF